jgi:hypothetical protein
MLKSSGPPERKETMKPVADAPAGTGHEPAVERVNTLDDYQSSYPSQLILFQFKQREARQYSNTIELYDFMPKYHWGKVERLGGESLCVLEREFECRGVKYKIEIAPAVIKGRDGINRYYYPSKEPYEIAPILRQAS